MALIARSRITNRFPSVWVDPDTTKNRVFVDTYAYDLTTLAPRANEQFIWQDRRGVYNTSATVSYDAFAPVTTGYMDANAWADGYQTEGAKLGIFDLWQCSLDYQNYKPTRIWQTAQNRILCTYPRTADTNYQYGDWWMGFDMARKCQSFYTQTEMYYAHLFEHVESRNFNATSWSYSTTTITVNLTNHGLYYGDRITVTGAVMTSGTNAPNGEYVITQATDANAFQFTVGTAPTGTAAGTMNIVCTTRRSWGFRHKASSSAYTNGGMSFDMIQGYDYLQGESNGNGYSYFKGQAGASRPYQLNETNEGGQKFFIGKDSTNNYAWVVHVNTASTGVASQTGDSPYVVKKYQIAQGIATATTVLAATKPTGTMLVNTITMCPSNLRIESLTRRIFYSSHYLSTAQAPMRFVIDMEGGTAVATQCVLTYPSGTTYDTYAALPGGTGYGTYGYNTYWSKPHQWTQNSVNYITFCIHDKYYWATTARFSTRKARTWLTFTISSGINDQNLTFHSAITFENASEFPLSWMPYTQAGNKLVIASTTNTGVWTFNPTNQTATSWTYSTSGSVSQVTVTKAAHGYKVGDRITISGTTAVSNAPNGNYQILSVPSTSTFTFNCDANNTGVIVGSAGGTMNISSGWQQTFASGIRARGYGVDRLGRLWVTTATQGLGTTEIHLLKESTPYKVVINFQNPVASSVNTFEFLGSTTSTNILVSAYDISGTRLAAKLTLTIKSGNMTFAGGLLSLNVTTSATGDTSVPVTVTGPGQALISTTTVA